ncbi:MAG: glycosyltransferase [Thermoanaerobaculia bacterium]|nr:glycosyltransferase [Thermoanaerobaculia bacterium]
MTTLGLVAAGLALATGLVAVLNALVWRRVRPGAPLPAGTVSVLIPARDEEHNLPLALESALAQGRVPTEILVYDDGSTDGTAAVVDQFTVRDPRIRLVSGSGELPPGWCGKPHALAQLAAQARGDWLLFLDADTRLGVGGLAALIAAAEENRSDLVSAWPRLEMFGWAERFLLPLLNFVTLTLYPTPVQFYRRDAALGLAHGACILVRASAYRAVGGHGAVRGEIFEDTALARAFRAARFAAHCLDGQDVARVRMYDSFGAIWAGFRKNFRPGFRRGVSFWLFQLFHLLAFVAPAPAALGSWWAGGDPRPWLVALAAGLVARLALALRFGHPVKSVLLHPAAEAVMVALGLASWWAVTSGRGVDWKARTYSGRGAA